MNANTKRFEDLPRGLTMVAFEMQRDWIDEKNLVPFLEFWNPERITAAGRLPDVFSKVLFMIGGYDHDERAVFEIPEVRDYLTRLVEAWPYFFFADNLESSFLCDLMQCVVPRLTVGTHANSPDRYTSRLETEDVNRVYRQLLDGLVRICPMDATMNQQRFDARVEAIQTHIRRHFHAG